MTPPQGPRAQLLLACAAAAILGQLALRPRGIVGAGLVVLALVAAAGSARLAHEIGRAPRGLWPTVAVLATVAVARAPIGSHDLWSYASYGRALAVHHVSPYTTTPRRFPDDLVYPLVGWRDTPSVYGPVFTAYSAAVARLAGGSLTALRLAFQIPAAAAMIACLRVLARSGRHVELTLIALQPFVWVSVVNGGHNDAVLAFLLLAAVLASRRGRTTVTAALVTVAVLVKMSAGLLVIPLVVSALTQRRRRDASILVALPTSALVISGAAIPGLLTNVARATGDTISEASIWRPLELATAVDPRLLTTVAGAVVLALAVAVSWRHRHDPDPALAGGATLAVFPFAASYTLPWYAVWGLPIAALSADVVTTGLIAARGSLLAASYQLHGATILDDAASVLLSGIAPTILMVLFVRRVLLIGETGQLSPAGVAGSR